MDIKKISGMIDHTLLKPDAAEDAIIKLCLEAVEYSFCSVCVNSFWIERCVQELKDSSVKVCTVVGFPLGAVMSSVKEYEAKRAIDNGASEIDMVLNVGALKSGLYKEVASDIRGVVEACGKNALSKVILEMCLLTPEEKEMAIKICMNEGAGFVKTSTGFSTGNATVEDVKLMRKLVGEQLGVKASGGIRSYDDAVKMIEAGASRIGTSAGKIIVEGGVSTTSY